jgi:uncharacterized Ntn-hydrolase superfamily protein
VTFSIVVHDPDTGQFGVGAITAEPAVGKLVSHARARGGAIATQATINPYLGLDGLRLLEQGQPAAVTLDQLIAADPGREARQVGIVDAQGSTAAHTGDAAPDWAGHLTRDHVAVQGNRLVGPETLEATLAAYLDSDEEELPRRILAALAAGEETGADRSGARSGTILVVDSEEYPLWDVRIDSADDPVAELAALIDEFDRDLLPVLTRLSTRADPMGQAARGLLEDEG